MKETTRSARISEQLNAVYAPLEQRARRLLEALRRCALDAQLGWYNGHYRAGDDGEYHREAYPIPVIEVRGCCDIELEPDGVTITTRQKRADALEYSYEKMSGLHLEVYGVDDYLLDFYKPGSTIDEMKSAIRRSGEAEIAFSFRPDSEMGETELCAWIQFLRGEGFYA